MVLTHAGDFGHFVGRYRLKVLYSLCEVGYEVLGMDCWDKEPNSSGTWMFTKTTRSHTLVLDETPHRSRHRAQPFPTD